MGQLWKKFQSLLFEEEDESVEETTQDTANKIGQKSAIAQMNPELAQEKEEKSNFLVEENEDDQLDSILGEEKEVESSFGLQVDKKFAFKDEAVAKVYEFHPMLSPMFGIRESKLKATEPRILEEARATLPRSLINTVISPIYGDLEVKKQSRVQVLAKDIKLKKAQTEDFVEIVADEILIEEKQFNNEGEENDVKLSFEHFDLDNLMDRPVESTPEKSEEIEDDSHQFSLFDDFK